ncbi:MAG TPA: GntR family transcriptional regulator [Rugosimonospora sp.]|nr:GntR family transcriptional regulator [Rugosimonospora sp.]
MITADPEGARYKRLAALLRARINSGELAVGQRLPSEKDLQDEYGMARETIRKAVGLLRSEGLVEVRQGHGTFVRHRGEQQVIKLAKGERATTRMPTPVERQDLELAEGVPMLVVTAPSGEEKHYPGDTIVISC